MLPGQRQYDNVRRASLYKVTGWEEGGGGAGGGGARDKV
jgi:hypothetical protein